MVKQERLRLYLVDIKYIRDLSRVDHNVLSVSPQIHKSSRPFIGIIVICENKQYCVPLSSPKDKHLSMNNDADFTKIYDGEKLIGVLNFNSMIPVTNDVIQPMDIRPDSKDDGAIAHYKKLTKKQLSFCQKNQEAIVRKANRLYWLITTNKGNAILRKRCCNFTKLESVSNKRLSKR